MMTDQEIIKGLKEDRDGNWEIDLACIERLRKYANQCGENGEIADELLNVICRLLDL